MMKLAPATPERVALPWPRNGSWNSDAVRQKSLAILRLAPAAHIDDALALARSTFDAGFARAVSRLVAVRDDQARVSASLNAEADRLQGELHRNTPPTAARTFILPTSPWVKLAFFSLFALGLGIVVAEIFNLAYYLRFRTDSVAWAILLTIPLSAIPVAEVIVLQHLSTRGRNAFALIQLLVAIGATAAYLDYSLRVGDTSLADLFAADHQDSGSMDAMRMLFQVVASLSLSGLALGAAIALGGQGSAPNPDYESGNNRIAALRQAASKHDLAAAEAAGELEEIKHTIQCELHFLRMRLSQLDCLTTELRLTP